VAIDIDFDSLYYTSITAYQDNKTAAVATFSDPNRDANNDVRDADPKRSNPERKTDLPITIEPRGVNKKGTGHLNSSSKKDASAVADVADSIYTSSRGDMLNVQLRIIGDPAFIKQDDIYYNPMSPAYQNYSVTSQNGLASEETVPINPSTGQIIFDQEQVFVQLLIKSAVDIDDATGITNKQVKLSNGRMTDSTFSGVYKLIKVKSEFNRGKFEQTLEMVKMPNDLFYDDTVKTTPKVELKAKVAQTETTTPTPTPVVGTGLIAGDETQGGQVRAGEQDRLKAAAAEPPTNPVASSPGEGTVATAPQPTEAAPSNANDATAIAPQEKAATNVALLLDQNQAEANDLTKTRSLEVPLFNAELAKIRNDNTLSASEKADKVIALREGLQATLRAQADQIVKLSLSTYKIDTEPGSDQSRQKLKLLTQLANLQKETTEFFQAQAKRIETVKQTGIA
jgi:hypothetical protein